MTLSLQATKVKNEMKELDNSSYWWKLKRDTSFPWKEKHLVQVYPERSFSHGTWEQEILNDVMSNVSSSEPWAMQMKDAYDGYRTSSIKVQDIILKCMCYPENPQFRHAVSPSVFY